MRKMKDSGVAWIGAIPEEWSSTPLLSVFHERKCKNIGLKEKNVLSLSYGKIIKRNIETNMGLMPASFETYNIVENMNIVLRLTDLQNDKTSLRTGLVTENGIITSAYTTLEANDLKDTRFFSFLLRCYDELKVLYNMGNGVRQNLKFGELSQLPVLLPPFSEQHRIADFLDTKCAEIDRSMELVRQSIDKLKEYKKSVITEAVTRGLDPDVPMKDSGVPWIGETPETWIFEKLKNFFTFEKGINAQQYTKEYIGAHQGDFPVYSGQTENDGIMGRIDSYDYDIQKCIFTTTVGAKVMSAKLISGKFSLSQNCLIMKPINTSVVVEYFLYVLIALFEYEKSLIPTYMQPSLRISDLSKYSFFIPKNLGEQKQIVAYLHAKCAEIDTLITQKQALLDKLAEYKKSLIFECVTGKREVAA